MSVDVSASQLANMVSKRLWVAAPEHGSLQAHAMILLYWLSLFHSDKVNANGNCHGAHIAMAIAMGIGLPHRQLLPAVQSGLRVPYAVPQLPAVCSVQCVLRVTVTRMSHSRLHQSHRHDFWLQPHWHAALCFRSVGHHCGLQQSLGPF